jgi:putative membrane protein
MDARSLDRMFVSALLLLADGGWWDGHMSGGWWIVMMIGMILFWAFVVVAVVWLIRSGPELFGSRTGEREQTRPDALEILERRLAQGEISVEEYRERRSVLDERQPAAGV